MVDRLGDIRQVARTMDHFNQNLAIAPTNGQNDQIYIRTKIKLKEYVV